MSDWELAASEQAFQDCLLAPKVDDSTQLLADIGASNGALSAEQRLLIYHDAYRLRLQEILEGDFPKLSALMGPADFKVATLAYIAKYPSTSPMIHDFGAHFPAFLVFVINETSPALAASHSELAQFEWAMGRALEAADHRPVTREVLAALAPEDWPTLHFGLPPSSVFFRVTTDVVSLWEALPEPDLSVNGASSGNGQVVAEQPCCAAASAESGEKGLIDTLDASLFAPLPAAQAVLVWRQGIDLCRYQLLTEVPAQIITRFIAGDDFQSVCNHLCTYVAEDAVAMTVMEYIQEWLSCELLVLS